MTREQIKKIVRLTESIVNKRLNEAVDAETLRENALESFQKLRQAWENKWKSKIIKAADKEGYDGEELWYDLVSEASRW